MRFFPFMLYGIEQTFKCGGGIFSFYATFIEQTVKCGGFFSFDL